MKELRGHIDGDRVVLDDPVPNDLPPLAPVRVVLEDPSSETVLDRLAKLAETDDLPADYSEQHDHYVKGTPCR